MMYLYGSLRFCSFLLFLFSSMLAALGAMAHQLSHNAGVRVFHCVRLLLLRLLLPASLAVCIFCCLRLLLPVPQCACCSPLPSPPLPFPSADTAFLVDMLNLDSINTCICTPDVIYQIMELGADAKGARSRVRVRSLCAYGVDSGARGV